MAPPGVELLVAVRRDGVVPVLVVGLGGVYTEVLDDVAIVPLPRARQRVSSARDSLRGAPLLDGARGRPPADIDAVARLAPQLTATPAGCADRAQPRDRPRAHGAVAVDALRRQEVLSMNEIAAQLGEVGLPGARSASWPSRPGTRSSSAAATTA